MSWGCVGHCALLQVKCSFPIKHWIIRIAGDLLFSMILNHVIFRGILF